MNKFINVNVVSWLLLLLFFFFNIFFLLFLLIGHKLQKWNPEAPKFNKK